MQWAKAVGSFKLLELLLIEIMNKQNWTTAEKAPPSGSSKMMLKLNICQDATACSSRQQHVRVCVRRFLAQNQLNLFVNTQFCETPYFWLLRKESTSAFHLWLPCFELAGIRLKAQNYPTLLKKVSHFKYMSGFFRWRRSRPWSLLHF